MDIDASNFPYVIRIQYTDLLDLEIIHTDKLLLRKCDVLGKMSSMEGDTAKPTL